MPLYMDVHDHVEGLTEDAVTGAHQKGVDVRNRYGVQYLPYWFNEGDGQGLLSLGGAEPRDGDGRPPRGARARR